MPFIAPKGNAGPQRPPWVKDNVQQQTTEVPWRKQNAAAAASKAQQPQQSNNVQPKAVTIPVKVEVSNPAPEPAKAPEPVKAPESAKAPGPAPTTKPEAANKLQISLKSTVKKPEAPKDNKDATGPTGATKPTAKPLPPTVPIKHTPKVPEPPPPSTQTTKNEPKSIPITIVREEPAKPPAATPKIENTKPGKKGPTQNRKDTLELKAEPRKAPEPAPVPVPPQVQPVAKPPGKEPKMPAKDTKSNAKEKTLPVAQEKVAPVPVTKAKNAGPAPPPPPPPPPAPPGPPPPPPPPGMMNGLPPTGKPPSKQVIQKLENLRKQPRRRPDWSEMMKEIETGMKLKKVHCNDRSRPIIPKMKSRGKFVFDSEAKPATKTDALHNRLLNEIQGGVKLKKVDCNDRSRPFLGGLRGVRRQLTIEENDKGEAAEEAKALMYEMEDIDTLRDELQSAKQMLETEAEAKLHVSKQNQDFRCQMITMEAEIETLKARLGLIPENEVTMVARTLDKTDSKTNLRKSRSGLYKSPSIAGVKKSKSRIQDHKHDEDDLDEINELEEEITTLKGQVQQSKKNADDWESKYREAMQKLLVAQGNLEDSQQKCLMMEKRLERATGSKGLVTTITDNKGTQTEQQILERRISRQMSQGTDAISVRSQPSYEEESEEESDVEIDEAEILRRKYESEIKLWENKLNSMKDKQNASRLERKNLKNTQKSLEGDLKGAKKRHKELQKEVDKMANMLKESNGDNEDEEEEEEDEEEEESEDESEEEESESDEEEESSSEEDDSEAAHDVRMTLFSKRVKRRENILNALRKGNYLLRANIDRLRDDLEEARIKYLDLEHELNTVLGDM